MSPLRPAGRTLVLTLALAAIACGAVAQRRLPEPTLPPKGITSVRFGDDRDLALLGGLLEHADPLLRERAAADLGLTDNPRALPLLAGALKDDEPKVRRAAVAAIAELAAGPLAASQPHQAAALIEGAFADDDPRMAWTLLAAVRRLELRSPKVRAGVEAILQRPAPYLQAAALETLTRLGWPAASLGDHLASAAPQVRLRALANTMLLDAAAARPLAASQARLAADPNPAVAGAALAALGKFDSARAAPLLPAAREHASPLVRRGALEALVAAGKTDAVRPFLDDPSPLVRLAAIEAAGRLKAADCVDRLFQLMLDAPYDDWFEHPKERTRPVSDPHLAARDALARIATPRVAKLAAARLARVAPDLTRREALRAGVMYAQSRFARQHGGTYDWSLAAADVPDLNAVWRALHAAGARGEPSPARGIWVRLSPNIRRIPGDAPLGSTRKTDVLNALKGMLRRRDLYTPEDFQSAPLIHEGQALLDHALRQRKPGETGPTTARLKPGELARLNRLLIEAALGGLVRPGPSAHALGLARRDTRACCALLAAARSKLGRRVMLDLLEELPLDSTALLGICEALSSLREPAAVAPLIKLVKTSQINGLKAMIAQAALSPPPLPFGERVSAGFVQALGKMKARSAADAILGLARVQFQNGRLNEPSVAAIEVLPALAAGPDRAKVVALLQSALAGDAYYPEPARFHAAKGAVLLKVKQAEEALQKIMNEERSSREMIHVAAWAIQELTGATFPTLPDPRRAAGDWIIRAVEPKRK